MLESLLDSNTSVFQRIPKLEEHLRTPASVSPLLLYGNSFTIYKHANILGSNIETLFSFILILI